jgi:Bacterial sugar transferase
MVLIIGVIVAVVAVVAVFAAAWQLKDEFEAWTQWIINHLVNRAVRGFAQEERSRFEEEWLAHLNELPGKVDKIIAALGFLSNARRISSALSVVKRILDAGASVFLLLYCAPLLLAVAMLIMVQDGWPVLTKRKQKWNGKTVSAFKFRTEDITGRCTPVGRILRYLKIDELPTLINVLRGDMTMSMFVVFSRRHGRSSG